MGVTRLPEIVGHAVPWSAGQLIVSLSVASTHETCRSGAGDGVTGMVRGSFPTCGFDAVTT